MNPETFEKELRLTDPETREFLMAVVRDRLYQELTETQQLLWELLICYSTTDYILPRLAESFGLKSRQGVAWRLRSFLKQLWELHPDYADRPFGVDITRTKKLPLLETMSGVIYDLAQRGYSIEELVEEAGGYERLVNYVTVIRKTYDENFLKSELRRDKMKQERARLDELFSHSRDHDQLQQGFESSAITSKYILEARKSEVLTTLKDIARVAVCPYTGPLSQNIIEFLRASHIFIGVYHEKKKKENQGTNKMYLVPLSYRTDAINALAFYGQVKQIGGKPTRVPSKEILLSDEAESPFISLLEVIRESQLELIDKKCPVPIFVCDQQWRVSKVNVNRLQDYLQKKRLELLWNKKRQSQRVGIASD